jgi:hypothetical protein
MLAAVHQALDAAYAAGGSYEPVRVALVIKLRCTYGAASDLIAAWEQKEGKVFIR